MTFESRDPAYLWDMLDAAQSIQSFTAGVDLQAYLKNEMMQYAVERQLTVVGEAARRVSEGFKKTHPEIRGGNLSLNETFSLISMVRSGMIESGKSSLWIFLLWSHS